MSAAAVQGIWVEAPATQPKRLMAVMIKLWDRDVSYERAYASTWDAYDDAFNRYSTALRIEVKPVAAASEARAA